MQAGKLRHRITLQSKTDTIDDSDGERTEAWVDAFTSLPAEILPLSGRELIAASATSSRVATRIVVRYRPGIVASMRAVHRDVYFAIEAVVPDKQSGNQWLTLHCASGVTEG
jgi:SPP1 family predicted phage head-tail adaptor